MIKSIIFDWGGVLTKGKYTQALLETISKDRSIVISDIYEDFDKLVIEMNEGISNFSEFVQKVEEEFSLKISETEMKEIFRKSIILNEEVIQIVKSLHSRFNLIMLSNNDEVTIENIKQSHKDIFDLFSKKYFSHELKMRKPSIDIFKYVLKDLDYSSSECIFIDDKKENIDAAAKVGLKGIIFVNAKQLRKELALLL